MNSKVRTDLALEAQEFWREVQGQTGQPDGVRFAREEHGGFVTSTVEILDERGESALGKPRGKYVTLELDGLIHREENAFSQACSLLSEQLRGMLGLKTDGQSVLVAGLGNREITPDAIGPESVECVMVTRHLTQQLPEYFGGLRPVCAVCAGVLGTTGIESGDIISALTRRMSPSVVVAVDALASGHMDRLCRTVQLSDTGIVPGSGVGNARKEINAKTLGVPVVAIGVPTVVDAATLALRLAERSDTALDPDTFGEDGSMIVTPRDIDKKVKDISKLIGYSLNLALHRGLTINDIDMFLS